MKRKISVRLSEEIVGRLEAAAQRPGTNKTTILEAALDRFLDPGAETIGHTKIESTVRYLGIEIDDAIEIAEKIDV